VRSLRTISRPFWSVAALLVVVLSTVLYWPFVLGGKVVFWGTPMLQFWPWREFAARELRAGRLPLWNPYAGNGTPLLADHQSAVLYPLNLIFWLLPVERAMGLSLALHAVLAGLTMYALARELALSRVGSLVAALAFMLSGYMVARGSFLTEVAALPWLPLMWLYGGRLVRRFRLRDLLLLSAVIALQFLAGHAQTWFYSLVSLALYGAWTGVTTRPVADVPHPRPGSLPGTGESQAARPQSGVWRVARRISRAVAQCWPLPVAVACGVLLVGAQFLPTLELSYMAGRAGRADWEAYALQYSLWPWRLLSLLLPDFFGNPATGDYWGYATYWEDAGYVGVLPFVSALLAIAAWFRWRRTQGAAPALRHVPPFGLLALFALLMALGKNTPFYMFFFRHVPGFGAFQAPARWLCVYTPAVALLAGLGIDALRPSGRLTFVCRLAAVGSVGIALTTGVAKMLLGGVKATFFGPLIQFAVLLAATMVLFLWGQSVRQGEEIALGRFRIGSTAWQVAVVLLVAVDLVYAGRHLNPAVDASLYAPQTATGSALHADGPRGRTFYPADARETVMWERYLDFGDYGPSSAAFWRGMREALLPDMGMVENLPSANSFEPLVEARYHELLQAVEDMEDEVAWRTLGLMNVAYVLDPTVRVNDDLFYWSSAIRIYCNPYLLPRAYVVYRARTVGSGENALAVLASPEFDPSQEVVLEIAATPPGADAKAAAANPEAVTSNLGAAGAFVLRGSTPELRLQPGVLPPGVDTPEPATLLLSAPNRVTIEAVLPQPGYLVLADTFYPGWRARVDGQRVDVWRANYAFRAVALDAGEHSVSFEYRPVSFTAGLACSGLALAAMVAGWIWLGRQSRQHTKLSR
jgi:hypothetical protein